MLRLMSEQTKTAMAPVPDESTESGHRAPRIGIYSGSFNPVHLGHVALCDYLVAEGIVDEVWLIRSPLNPLKADAASTLAPDVDRAEMLRLAIEGHEGLRVCTIEDDLPRPNYSILTFHALEQQYPGLEFHLIIGADNWLLFERWRAYDEFLTRYHLVVYPRPGYPLTEAERLRLGQDALQRVRFVEAPQYDVSSTAIRQAVAEGTEPPLLDARVYAYVLFHHLYQS